MHRRNLDGVTVGDAFGRLWEIFEPPWWRVDRWVRLLARRKATRIRLTIQFAEGAVQVRAVRSPIKLATVPEVDDAAALHDWMMGRRGQ